MPSSLSTENELGIAQKKVTALEHVLFAERALSERSSSLKLLLEHLALTVPRT
ncbi:MAG: hypothetical protein AAB869_02110 [Patescibacteria group bacterium]